MFLEQFLSLDLAEICASLFPLGNLDLNSSLCILSRERTHNWPAIHRVISLYIGFSADKLILASFSKIWIDNFLDYQCTLVYVYTSVYKNTARVTGSYKIGYVRFI